MSEKKPPETRSSYPHFRTMPTRWMDNDQYGHVNNVVYYSFFDTLLNRYLIDEGGLDFRAGAVIGIAVETQCRFHSSFSYPEEIQGGLRIGHLGRSSVRYEIGLFAEGEETARADGYFVHVFVDRESMRPTDIPARMRSALQSILVN